MGKGVKEIGDWRVALSLLLIYFACFVSRSRAEDFGDIWVAADLMYTGTTVHGYAETRLTLENRSISKSHVVTLNYPNNDVRGYGGNRISRISRTVGLAAGTRQIVTLLQPPLATSGDGSIEVVVDGRREGEIRSPNANNHCVESYRYSGGGAQIATVFISRNLDFDAVQRLFNAGKGPFSAAMAVGPPDATSGGYDANNWMPDMRYRGAANWLKLDYATPQTIDKIFVYSSQTLPPSGDIAIIGDAGSIVSRVAMSSGSSSSTGSDTLTELSLPTTSVKIKSLTLNFGTASPSDIGIDAVEISGAYGMQWASDASASSDNTASAPRFSSGTRDSVEGLRAEMPSSQWSSDWLAYTPFDFVALPASDLASLPPEARAALWSYVQAGGNVAVFGTSGVPEEWRSGPNRPVPNGTEYNAGLGHAFVFKLEIPANLDPDTVTAMRNAMNDAARYWRSLPEDSDSANSLLHLVENLQVPTRGIVSVMLIFVILIGPVNIIVLNRKKRRTWMLWTIPAISFATTAMVFGYSFLREGITPTVHISGLTVLNQTTHQAETVGAEGLYCPLTPSGGLHFDSETEATPLVSAGYGSGSSREVDWSQSQQFTSGWVSSRVPAFFHVRKSELRRERLQFDNKDGHNQVINGLGAPIKSLWLADGGLTIYVAHDIPAGQSAPLVLSTQPQNKSQSGPELLLRDISFAAGTDSLDQKAGNFLTPNSYIAVLDGNPFMENPLGAGANLKLTRASAVVFGFLEAGGGR